MWWWLLVGCVSSQVDEARKHLETHEGPTWIRTWRRYGLSASMGLNTGQDAPAELGARKAAVARCGLQGDEGLSAIVTAPDTDVGPWDVEILSSPDPETGACVARLLEAVPWDREHPGSTMILAFRTTGKAVAAWIPREEEPMSECERTGRMGFVGGQAMRPRWNEAFSCPSDIPLTRVELELQPGGAGPTRLVTTPPVPCVEDRVRSQFAELARELGEFRVIELGTGPIRCTFDVPLVAP